MCGRYVMSRALGDLVAASGAVEPEEEIDLRANWNVAPTTDVPIILERPLEDAEGVRRGIHVARWGLVPPWAKDAAVGSRAFNARSETVTEKPTFRAAVKARRCTVPADGYFEWLKPEVGAPKGVKKRPFYVHPGDGVPIFFAGLYEWWKDPTTAEDDPARWLLSCTILTGPAPEAGTGGPDPGRPGGLARSHAAADGPGNHGGLAGPRETSERGGRRHPGRAGPRTGLPDCGGMDPARGRPGCRQRPQQRPRIDRTPRPVLIKRRADD